MFWLHRNNSLTGGILGTKAYIMYRYKCSETNTIKFSSRATLNQEQKESVLNNTEC